MTNKRGFHDYKSPYADRTARHSQSAVNLLTMTTIEYSFLDLDADL